MYDAKDIAIDKDASMFIGGDEGDNHKEHPDPFLFTDSKIMTGQGKGVVCAVG